MKTCPICENDIRWEKSFSIFKYKNIPFIVPCYIKCPKCGTQIADKYIKQECHDYAKQRQFRFWSIKNEINHQKLS